MYDLIIIGAGPAGLTASIYASRYRIKHLVIGSQLGGVMSWAPQIENYPGFKKISGVELTKKMAEQAKALGGELKTVGITKVSRQGRQFLVETEEGERNVGRTLIIATGTKRRKLEVPGEDKYLGRGVSYCTTCDAAFFKDKTVAVVGGSNAAVMGALHLAGFGKQVYLIYRGKPLRAEPIWIEKIEKEPKIEVIYQMNVVEILGDSTAVTGIKLDKPHKGNVQLILDGVFIEIGGVPTAALVESLGLDLNDKGFIKVNPNMATNIPGVFAAGDVADACGELQQIVIATAEGAIASLSVYKFLRA